MNIDIQTGEHTEYLIISRGIDDYNEGALVLRDGEVYVISSIMNLDREGETVVVTVKMVDNVIQMDSCDDRWLSEEEAAKAEL